MLNFKEFLEGLPAVRLGPAPQFKAITGDEPEGQIVQFPAQPIEVGKFAQVPGGKVKGDKFEPKRTLGIPREKMPQLKSRDDFIEWLKTKNVKTQKIMMAPKDLIRDPVTKEKRVGHAQSHMEPAKAKKFVEKGTATNKFIILSKDGIIFDGNHHWLALMALAPKTPVPMVMVDLPFHDLRILTAQYPGVRYEEGFQSFSEWLSERSPRTK